MGMLNEDYAPSNDNARVNGLTVNSVEVEGIIRQALLVTWKKTVY